MKKNIDMININSNLLDWLITKLKGAPPDINDSEVTDSLINLSEGATESILMELKDTDTTEEKFNGKQLKCGDIVIYINSRKVLRNGEEIVLTPKEFDILFFLAKNRGEVFTKEQIYQAVWDDDYLLDDSNIMAFIRKLRKKIEVNPDDPKYILTIWGIGYKFTDNI